ncbi:hypothetical protein VUJ46_07445 [Chryseobacterium sp. MYb264]|uniref:hypothetical protein n=1 Tax=Chryseobacterium sp. MYb264 TaxID=2745153 RepID=UPI002E130609|nr:hypothetical protein VUJ46_07445 [Chryseobacterium sp. MYb264]
MNNQLSNIAVQYRKFSKGQYIEYTQFNEFLDFFEDQDRLSRVMLQGVGIVCGLKHNLIYTNKLLNSIQLSQGVAVTTDGDLLTLNNTNTVSEDLYVSDLKTIDIENKNYTHFRVYDNFKVNYKAFHEIGGAERQIELWELATANEATADFQLVGDLPDLEDKYLLLYLESYEKDVKPCRGVDCDNHGVQQIRNLKVLVTTKSGLDIILGQDRIQPHPLFIEEILKPEKQERVIVERLILENDIKTKFYSSTIKKMYSAALERGGYGETVFKKINAISQMMGISGADHSGFKMVLEQYLSQDTGFQYAYDVVKDLNDTYSEIIKWLPHSFTKGFPDLDSFPKHVMLGKLVSEVQLDPFRHQFYNSPVLDDDRAIQKVKLLINRFNQQVRNFGNLSFQDRFKIKITPSQKLNPLSNKSIPFYYKMTEELLKSWNFDKTANRSSGENLAYDTGLLSSLEHTKNPNDFNIDRNSFYNIEGHQGMPYDEVFEKVKEIKDKQQLAFDIMVLSMEELVDNKDLFKSYFNEYAEKHPGIEHLRGVERGGTFIIVYESVENPIVFADFSLPYICCTPKIIADLSLPHTVICAEADRMPFTVLPVGGVVKANVDLERNGVEVVDGKYFFNPKQVDASLYGKVINFTVNDKPVSFGVKVTAEPEVLISVSRVDYPEGLSEATTVYLLIDDENFKDYTYSWDFWDNGSYITLTPDAEGRVNFTYVNLDPKRVPTIKVKVSGNGCTQEVAIRDWYEAPKVELFLGDSVICSDYSPIDFIVSPVGGVVTASHGDGVQFVNGKYVFDPTKVDESLYGQTITFKVNDQQTDCSIKVIAKPSVTVDLYSVNYPNGSSTEATVYFKVSGPGFSTYTYAVNGTPVSLVQPGEEWNLSYTFTNLNPENIPVIKVTVTNGGCIQAVEISKWYSPPRVELSLSDKEQDIIVCSDSPYIPFKVSPANGVVEANQGHGVQYIAGQYVFDPKSLEDYLHNTVIKFTVNGQPTTCTATVITQPDVTVEIGQVDYSNSTQAMVNFTVSGASFKNYAYSINGTAVALYTDGDGVGHLSYTINDPKNSPLINVTVSNGKCAQTFAIRGWYNPPAPRVVINSVDFPKGNCCEGASAHNVKAFVESNSATIYLSQVEVFRMKGWGEGALSFDYSWFQVSSNNGKKLPILQSTLNMLELTQLTAGIYVFHFMVIDSKTGFFDTTELELTIE